MKIEKKQPNKNTLKKRRLKTTFQNSLIIKILNNNNDDLIAILESYKKWNFGKSDLNSWIDVLNKFDRIFEGLKEHYEYVEALGFDKNQDKEKSKSKTTPNFFIPIAKETFPFRLIKSVLAFTELLTRHCTHVFIYNSFEHLSTLLALCDTEIIVAVLQICGNLEVNMGETADPGLHKRLLPLINGWGGTVNNTSLRFCVESKLPPEELPKIGSHLHFEFYRENEEQNDPEASHCIIDIPDLHNYSEKPVDILQQLVSKYQVPKAVQYDLLVGIQRAQDFVSAEKRIMWVHIRLLALTVFEVAIGLSTSEGTFFMHEPEFIHELVDLLRCDDSLADIKTSVLETLLVLSADPNNFENIIIATGSRLPHGLIPTILRKNIALTIENNGNRSAESGEFFEVLFEFLLTLISSNGGAVALSSAGVESALIPLIMHVDENHIHLVTRCIKLLKTFMDVRGPSLTLFRNLGGIEKLIERIHYELVHKEEPMNIEKDDENQIESKKYSKRLLLKISLGAIGLPIYSQSAGRLTSIVESSFPESLKIILENPKTYGGSLWALAASRMAALLHAEPTVYPILENAGLPEAFLASIEKSCIPVSSSSICAVPNALRALCLPAAGLELIKSKPFAEFLNIFNVQKYTYALTGGTSSMIGTGFDELIRHNPDLRPTIIDACINLLSDILEKGYHHDTKSSKAEEDSKENATKSKESVENEVKYLTQTLDNVSKLLSGLLATPEHAQMFIDKKGIDYLLDFFSIPKLPSSFLQAQASSHIFTLILKLLSTRDHFKTILKTVIENMLNQFEVLDSLGNWREGENIYRGHHVNTVKLQQALTSLNGLIGLLAVLVRNTGVAYFKAIIAALSEWNTEQGVKALTSLGQLQRAILWEIGEPDIYVEEDKKKKAEKEKEKKEKKEKKQEISNNAQENNPPEESEPIPMEEEVDPAAEKVKPNEDIKNLILVLVVGVHSLSAGMVRILGLSFSKKQDDATIPIMHNFSINTAQHLSWETKNNNLEEKKYCSLKYSYLTNIFGELASLFFDERKNITHTLLLHNFTNENGIENVVTQLEWLVNQYKNFLIQQENNIDVDKAEKDSVTLFQLTSALIDSGKFLHNLSKPDMILASPHTENMMVLRNLPGEAVGRPFDPHRFIGKIHRKLLVGISSIWQDEHLSKFPAKFLVFLTSIVHNLLENKASYEGIDFDAVLEAPKPEESFLVGCEEMGFSRDHAKEAFKHIGVNNIEIAMDWLLSNPPPEISIPVNNDDNPDEIAGSEDDELAKALAMSLATESIPNSNENENEKEKEDEEKKEKEEDIAASQIDAPKFYSILSDNLIDSCIALLKKDDITNDDLSFALIELLIPAFRREGDELRKNFFKALEEQINLKINSKNLENLQLDVSLKPLAHVLAGITASDSKSSELFLQSELVSLLLSIVKSTVENLKDPEQEPKWLSTILLIFDSLAMISFDKDVVKVPENVDEKEEETPEIDFSQECQLSREQQIELLTILNNLLSKNIKDKHTLQGILLLIAQITRTKEMAQIFVDLGGLTQLLNPILHENVKDSKGDDSSKFLGSYQINTILHHLLDEEENLKIAFENCIKQSVLTASRRSGNARVTPTWLVSLLAPLICRNPKLFVESAVNTCRLAPGSSNLYLAGREKEQNQDLEEPQRIREPCEPKIRKLNQDGVENINVVLNHLVRTLLSLQNFEKENEKQTILNRTKVVGILTDLITFYPQCIGILLNHYKWSEEEFSILNSLDSLTFYQEKNILNYFIEELTCYNRLDTELGECKYELHIAVSKFLAVICSRKEGRVTLIHEITKSFENTLQRCSDDGYCHPLHCLVDITTQLLTAKCLNNEYYGTDIAKVMITENLIQILTNAIQKIDLNHPKISNLVVSILKPLEHLIKNVATKKTEDIPENVLILNSILTTTSNSPNSSNSSSKDVEMSSPNKKSILQYLDEDHCDLLLTFPENPFQKSKKNGDDEESSSSESESESSSSDEEIQEGDNMEELNLEEGEEEENENEEDDDNLLDENQDESNSSMISGLSESDEISVESENESDEEEEDEGESPLFDFTNLLVRTFGGNENALRRVPVEMRQQRENFAMMAERALSGAERAMELSREMLAGRPLNLAREEQNRPVLLFEGQNEGGPSVEMFRDDISGVNSLSDLRRLVEHSRGGFANRSQNKGIHSTHLWTDNGVVTEPMKNYAAKFEKHITDEIRKISDKEAAEREKKNNEGQKTIPEIFKEKVDETKKEDQDVQMAEAESPESMEVIEQNEEVTDNQIENMEQVAPLGPENPIEVETPIETPVETPVETPAAVEIEVETPVAVENVVEPETPAENPVQPPAASGSSGIDQTFLDALPEDIRAEVLSSQMSVQRPAANDLQQALQQSLRSSLLGLQGNNENPPAGVVPPVVPGAAPQNQPPSLLGNLAIPEPGEQPVVAPAPNNESNLAEDFLAALPEELRAEVLEQERREQERVQRSLAEPAADIANAQEIDNASFVATLTPELREEVLMTADPQFLASLPPAMAAEAHALRERSYRQYNQQQFRAFRDRPDLGEVGVQYLGGRHVGVPHVGIRRPGIIEHKAQLIDQKGLEGLIRLLYCEQSIVFKGNNALYRILTHLSSFSETRKSLIEILMTILSAGTKQTTGKLSKGISEQQKKTLLETLNLFKKTPENSDKFSPLALPGHRLLGSNNSVQYHSDDNSPPPLVVRRIFDIFLLLVKTNSKVADWIYGILEDENSLQSDSIDLMNDIEQIQPLAQIILFLASDQIKSSSAFIDKITNLLKNTVLSITKFRKLKEVDNKSKIEQDLLENENNENLPNENENQEIEIENQEELPTGENQPELPVVENANENENQNENNENIPDEVQEIQIENQEEEKKEEGKKEEEKTPEYEIPELDSSILVHLTHVLTLNNITPLSCNNIVHVLEHLALSENNRMIIYDELLVAATSISSLVFQNLEKLREKLSSNLESRTETDSATLLSMFSSSSLDMNLLRVLKTILTLGKVQENISEFKSNLSTEIGLDSLWESLEVCLDYVNQSLMEDSSEQNVNKKDDINDKGKQKATSNANRISKAQELIVSEMKRNKTSSISSPALTILLPIIEVFFVLNGKEKEDLKAEDVEGAPARPLVASIDLSKSLSSANLGSIGGSSKFVQFGEKFRGLLNQLIRQNPKLLDESFSALVNTPRLIDFDNKKTYFSSQLKKRQQEQRYGGGLRINIRRPNLFEDSFHQLIHKTAEELRGKLTVSFSGEEGIDAGGLSREWYKVLAREMFNPMYGLFVKSDGDSVTFQPNKNSQINPDHLQYFKFIGRVIGKALCDGQMLDAYFTRSFYKHMLDLPVAFSDMETIDHDYYKNLKWILENDIEDVVDLTFTAQSTEFDVTTEVELKPGGKDLVVTNSNKEEYVKLITELRSTTCIKTQINSFLEGFHELVSKELISIFSDLELELLISGLPDIDIQDLKNNTEYNNYDNNSNIIQWFWQTVEAYTQEEKALLVQFVTGTSKVPLEGFSALTGMSGPQKFQIHKVTQTDRLPAAHTCFNQLDLPEYETQEKLKEHLNLAIRECSEGFGFG